MYCNIISSLEWHFWAKEGVGKLEWHNVVLPLGITLFSVVIWSVKKETSWKQRSLFKTVAQNKTQKKIISVATSYEICHCCQRKWRKAPRGICFLLAFATILSKYSVSFFHRAKHINYTPLMLLSCGLFRQNTLLHKMTGRWQILKKKEASSVISQI
jgi:hypothetical protein